MRTDRKLAWARAVADVGQTEAAWKLIEPKHDWRAPIHACIEEKDFEACRDACLYYTATELKQAAGKIQVVDKDGNAETIGTTIWVKAEGYRMGPAGP
jgi:hypothetical protein